MMIIIRYNWNKSDTILKLSSMWSFNFTDNKIFFFFFHSKLQNQKPKITEIIILWIIYSSTLILTLITYLKNKSKTITRTRRTIDVSLNMSVLLNKYYPAIAGNL